MMRIGLTFLRRGKGVWVSITLALLFCVFSLLRESHAEVLSTAAVTSISTGSIAFSWSSQDGNNYIAALGTGASDAHFVQPVSSGTTALNVTTTQYFNLAANTSYFLRVKVSTENDIGSLTNPPTSYLQISTFTLPVLPSLSLAGVGLSSATVNVAKGNNGANSSYMIQWSTVSSFGSGRVDAATGTLPAGNTTFIGLNSNSTYYFRAQTLWNGNLFQNASGFVTVSTLTLGASPPPALVSFLVTTNTVTITLSPNGNPIGATLAVTTGAFDSSSSSSGVSSAGNTTLMLSNLVPNRVYSVRAAVLSSGQVVSSTLTVASTATLPTVPVNLSTSLLGGTTITVSWSSNNNSLTPETSYQIQISSNDSGFSTFSTEDTFGFELTSRTLSMQTTYYYRVKTYGVGGTNSAFSSTASVITLFVPVSAPSTPTAITITNITTSAVAFSWIDNSDNEQEFRLLNSTGGIFATSPISSTFTQVIGLAPDFTLNVRIAAFNEVNTAISSAAISSHTLAEAPISPTFGIIRKFTAPISWSARSNPATVIYEISQSTTNFSYDPGISTPIAFSAGYTSTSAVIDNLSPGGTYYFRVRARNRDNILTAFAPVISTVTSTIEVFESTGGTYNAGLALVSFDPGVTITNFVLPNGTTQQTIVSTQVANVNYSNSIVLRLSSGAMLNAIVGVENLQVTSTQAISIDNAGLIVQGTSGTILLRLITDSISFSASTDSPQNFLATIPTVSTKTLFLSLTSGGNLFTISIPPGTFSETVQLRIKFPDFFPSNASAFASPAFSPAAAPSFLSGFGMGLELLLNSSVQPQRPVPITMTYQDNNIRGTAPELLVVSRFEETIQKWIPLPSRVNASIKSVTASTGHFSKFQLMAQYPATDVNQVKFFPNPLRLYRGQTEMIFTNLTAGASVKLYSVLGELVRTLNADATGTVRWDARNENHERVGSGVYVAMIEGAGSRKIVKVAVEK